MQDLLEGNTFKLPGCVDMNEDIVHLNQSPYRLEQAPNTLHGLVAEKLVELGFEQLLSDPRFLNS